MGNGKMSEMSQVAACIFISIKRVSVQRNSSLPGPAAANLMEGPNLNFICCCGNTEQSSGSPKGGSTQLWRSFSSSSIALSMASKFGGACAENQFQNPTKPIRRQTVRPNCAAALAGEP